MFTKYTTRTSTLKATIADIRTLNVGKIDIANIEADSISAESASFEDFEAGNISTDSITAGELAGETINAGELVAESIGVKDKDGKVQDLSELIDAAAVDIGDKTDDERYLNVSNLVFKGSYVNVVKDPNSSKVTLWINKSTAFPGLPLNPLNGAPVSELSAKLFANSEDDFALPVANGEDYDQITANVEDGTSFGSISMSLRNTDGNATFTANKSDSFWTRIMYNGASNGWIEVPFSTNAGTFDINTAYETAASPSPFSGQMGTKTDSKGATVNYYVRHFDDSDAEFGRVPGQAEVEIEIELDLETILVKDGGTVRFDWTIAPSSKAPNSFSSVNMFFTEYKKPTLTFTSATYKTKKPSAKISGLSYNTSGSTADITVTNIKHTQWKSSNTDNIRLSITAAGSTSNIKVGDTGLSDSGLGSDLDFSYTGTVTLGSSGIGSASISVAPEGIVRGLPTSKTLGTFWGSIPTSGALSEKFGQETYRMLTPTSAAGSYPSSEDVTTHKITGINNTNVEHCSAVCQYNALYHPANAAADATGKKYSTTETRPAVFIRTFTGTANNKFKLVASNLIQKNKVQVWWKDGNNWYDLSTHVKGNVEHSGTNTITKFILPENGETKRGDMTIAIVLQPGASAVGQITASFSA